MLICVWLRCLHHKWQNHKDAKLHLNQIKVFCQNELAIKEGIIIILRTLSHYLRVLHSNRDDWLKFEMGAGPIRTTRNRAKKGNAW